jgi:hypothetical protein
MKLGLIRFGGVGLLALSVMACSIFRPKVPSYVLEHMTQEEMSDWYSHNEGDARVWARNVHQLTLNPLILTMKLARDGMDEAVVNIREIGGELDSLQKAGGSFRITKTPGGKLVAEVSRPEGVVETATRAALAMLPFGNKDAQMNIVLNSVGIGVKGFGRTSEGVDAYYFACASERDDVQSGKPLSFDLPEGITRDDYLGVLDTSLINLDAASREVSAYRAALASTLAVLASLDSSKQGSVANLYLVLAASLEEREHYKNLQQAPFPTPPEQLAQTRKTADDLEKATLANPRYQAWKKDPHWVNPRAASDFAESTVDTFTQLSAIYAAMGGVDIVGNIREKLATGLDPGDMLDVALRLAPAGSKLQGILQVGKSVYTKVVDAKAKVEMVKGTVDAVVNDPTGAAVAGAPTLIAWAAPSEVAQARRVIDSLPAPVRPDGH